MKKIDMNQLSRRSFLKVAGAAGVVGSGMVLAGCDNGTQEPAADDTADDTEEEPAGTEYEPVTVHVAFMPNLGSAATLFSAIDQGYFEEVGITVETEQFQAGPAEITAGPGQDLRVRPALPGRLRRRQQVPRHRDRR